MMISREILSIIACPKCKKGVSLNREGDGLVCSSCNALYPIKEGIPIMLIEEAKPLGESLGKNPSPPSQPNPEPTLSAPDAVFKIVEGKGKGMAISLRMGTCRVVGRSLADREHTQVFSVDSMVTLDDFSKKVVMSYIERQFREASAKKGADSQGVGGFRRDPDFTLEDTSISRLHAMFFYDKSGVGVLDLVSKNGTFVNGVEVESKILKKGDLIAIGATKIRYE